MNSAHGYLPIAELPAGFLEIEMEEIEGSVGVGEFQTFVRRDHRGRC